MQQFRPLLSELRPVVLALLGVAQVSKNEAEYESHVKKKFSSSNTKWTCERGRQLRSDYQMGKKGNGL